MKRHPIYNSIVVWILVGFVTGLWGLAGILLAVGAKGKEEPPEADTAAVIAGNSEFALELYVRLSGDPNIRPASGNLFFSPYSISTALSMTYMGARGITAGQMADVLHFPTEPIKTLDTDSQGRPFYRMCERGPISHARIAAAFGSLERQLNNGGKKGGYELSVANALWGQKGYGFLKEFLTLTKESYGAGLREVDFVNAAKREKARKTINSWVEKETKEKIKDLIPPGVLDALTRLVLTNAIYFKGDWAVEFDKEETRDSPFKISADKEVTVPLMYQKGDFKYAQEGRLQILELPYKGDDLSMVVLLPTEVDGLADLEKSLKPIDLNRWLTLLRKQEVHVYLPKFKMTTGPLELGGVLKGMGMRDAFSLPPADFSGMTGSKDLFISNVLHKAFVAVDEKGTEAAAATAVVTRTTAVARPTVFRADHPFVFVIKDNHSGSILFVGRLTNPGKPAVSKATEPNLPQDKTGNFILYVSNQSFAMNPVDIKVYIDGQVAVDQEFDVGNQHNWQAFQYSLPNGTHQLRVQSLKGQAKLQKEFEVTGKHWAVLDYWFYPDTHYEPTAKHFTFGVSDKPVYFD